MRKLLGIVSIGIIITFLLSSTDLTSKVIESKIEKQHHIFKQYDFITNCLMKINEIALKNEKWLDRIE